MRGLFLSLKSRGKGPHPRSPEVATMSPDMNVYYVCGEWTASNLIVTKLEFAAVVEK